MPPLLTTTIPAYSRQRSLPTNILPARRRQSAFASIGLRKKNEIDIVLDGEAEFVHSYSTYDEIKGWVELRFEKDVQVDELIITFEGQTATYVEKIATTAPTTGRTTGKHTFLKLLQPVDSDQLPEDNILLAGETYSIPFTFVVPDRLLPYVCSHKVENETIRREHLQLPPSLGDPSLSGDGHMLMDDLSPAMARISYAIRARATGRLANDKIYDLAEKIERVRIVPGKSEDPPRDFDEEAADFVMRKEKSVRKGIFKLGKIGRLTAETTQPRSLRLPHPTKRSTEPITTMTTINLRFDPLTSTAEPPQLGSLVSKIRAYTFFGAAPYKRLPEVHRCDNWSNLHGLYPDSVELSSRNLSTVTWTKHDPTSALSPTSTNNSSDISRRPSTFSNASSASIPEPSSKYSADLPFYTASVLVPISLPNAYSSNSGKSTRPKIFLPSFYSCIVSRSYTLELNLSYQTPSTNVGSPSVTLKVPVQVSAEGGTPPEGIEESDEAIVAEIEQQFRLYEQRQLEDELGLESPGYEEDDSRRPLVNRSASIAVPSFAEGLAPRVGAARNNNAAPPPEYNARGTYRIQGGVARTMSETSSIWMGRQTRAVTPMSLALVGVLAV